VFIRFVVRLLGYPLKLLHQPKVISEILAGIVLGPTVLGMLFRILLLLLE
jgi:Kef-type K+ transport system membrane component KefB